MSEITKLVEWFKSQVGYTSTIIDGRMYTKYGEDIDNNHPTWYNGKKNGYNWCTQSFDDGFIQVLGEEKAKKVLNRPNNSLGAVVRYSRGYLAGIGRVGKTPKIGAAIYFGELPYPRHIGFVVDFDDTYVYTIEGNTTYNGKNGVNTHKYKRTYSDILDYGYPLYDDSPEPEPPTPGPKTMDGYTVGKLYEITCKEPLNVRDKATTKNSTVITSLKKGTTVVCKDLTHDSSGNTWMKISDPASGWICCIEKGDRYVHEAKSPKTIDIFTVGKTYTVIAKKGINIRSGPGKNYSSSGAISYNSKIKCIDVTKTGNNIWVRYSDGWLAAKYNGEYFIN